MGCGVDACYSTEPFSTTLVDILTITSGGKTITTTQVSAVLTTPTPPPALTAADDGAGVIPKFMPTSVPKASAIPKDNKDDDGGGGLKGAQLGGIIGGAIALLIIVIIAAFLIIRRLKRVESAMESKKGSISGYHSKASYTKTSKTGASKTEMEQSGRFLHVRAPSDADNASADPLMFMTETNTPGDHTGNTSSLVGTPQPGAHGGRHNRSGSDACMVSPHGGGGNNGSGLVSPDPNTGYFDGPSPPPGTHLHKNNGMRESVDSQSTAGLGYHYSTRNQNQNHWRHQSNASELSADGSEITHGVGSPLVGGHARGASGSGLNDVPELDSSGMFVELPATATASNTIFGESPILPVNPNNNRLLPRNSFGGLSPASRRTSNPSSPNPNLIHNSPNPNSPHARNDSTDTNNPLDVLSETAEFIPRSHQQQHTSLDGYYGPSDKQVGQTAAGLGFVPEAWDGSSPGAYPMGFPMISVPGYGLGVASDEGTGGDGDGRDDGHETHDDLEEGEGEGTLDTALDIDEKLEELEGVERGRGRGCRRGSRREMGSCRGMRVRRESNNNGRRMMTRRRVDRCYL
ncbi:unnamed protein product [Sordaria macrospora k-hell]|uniref:WGS project CABT00000000 data, contig 2.15 n=1 Tax=Sordaria macrospora (strain ATCC MYA-333 / DSM 997 / K(L3346) / K-hell) TaxID=771870 RepID=F7VZH5_SORMK|nr:uncharacterized protein SMAC_04152 [Sordaria macrospora k-hell]CCC10923.1 unnamed protein product [Sordaria macrospora k-hell]